MREKELRERAICAVCKKPFGNAGVPMFYTIKIERHGLNAGAVQRQDGLTAMLGGHAALASIMGPDEEMTTPLMDPVTKTICETCSFKPVPIVQLALEETDDDDG